MKFTIPRGSSKRSTKATVRPVFRILWNHRRKPKPQSDVEASPASPSSLAPSPLPFHQGLDCQLPQLTDFDNWSWDKMLDDESPFFKVRFEEERRPEQDAATAVQRNIKPCTIFLPKFKEFVYYDTDCSEQEDTC